MADQYNDDVYESEGSSSFEEESDDKPRSKKDVLKEAHKRMQLAAEAEADNRRAALEDQEFRAGKQWPDNIMADRNSDGRPCLVINRIPQFIQQITNDQRQNRPSIKVYPVDGKGDVETAKIIQGLVRHIEYDSNADVAYDTAFDSAATGGFGYIRVLTDFVDPLSFDQDILIKRVRNPMSVYFDPYSQEPDGSDANWGFIVDDLSEEEYKLKYPKSKLASMDDWESIGNQEPSWFPDSNARIAEYFYREVEEKEIALLQTGETVLAKDADPAMVIRTRMTMVPMIKWCKINGVEILEETEWLGKWIPIIPVYGNDMYVNGRRILEGIVRNAKDSQRMYNYWASAETEAIALAPRTPFIAAEGQIEGYEKDWKSANRKNQSVLLYRPVSLAGTPVPPPTRNVFEPAVQAITGARMLASEDLKATTGIYDAALGARSNETSGVAIQRRNQQAQTSNFHFIDNLTRSLRHVGRILVDLIPHVYDTARTARIIGDDGEQEIVQLNTPFVKNGKSFLYDLSVGEYDVIVDVGPSYATKRQEAVQSMLDMSKAYPPIAQFAGDLMIKNMDWPGAQEIAERIKKMLPPQLQDQKEGQPPIPPEVQQQMQQMSQMVEQLTQQLQKAQDERDQKTLELESKERIEFAKLETQATIELARLQSKEAVTLLQTEVKTATQRLQQQINELDARQQLLGIDQPVQTEEDQFQQSLDPGMGAAQPMGQDPTGGVPPGSDMEGI